MYIMSLSHLTHKRRLVRWACTSRTCFRPLCLYLWVNPFVMRMQDLLFPEQAAAEYTMSGLCTSHNGGRNSSGPARVRSIMSECNCNWSSILHNIRTCEAWLLFCWKCLKMLVACIFLYSWCGHFVLLIIWSMLFNSFDFTCSLPSRDFARYMWDVSPWVNQHVPTPQFSDI